MAVVAAVSFLEGVRVSWNSLSASSLRLPLLLPVLSGLMVVRPVGRRMVWVSGRVSANGPLWPVGTWAIFVLDWLGRTKGGCWCCG